MNIYDIAKEAGVSIATVSRVLNGKSNINEETRKKVEDVVAKHNYVANSIARGLAVNSSIRMVGIVIGSFAELAIELEKALQAKGFWAVFCNPYTGDIEDIFRRLKELRVDGLILIGSHLMNPEIESCIDKYHSSTPITFINGVFHKENISSVICDEGYGIQLCTEHLIDKGYSEIVYVMDSDFTNAERKSVGYSSTMEKHFGKYNKDYILKTERGLEGGAEIAKEIVERFPKVNAIMFEKDITAMGCIRRLEDMGYKIPEDYAVTGYDNSLLGKVSRHVLTTVDREYHEQVTEALNIFYNQLEGKEHQTDVKILPKLYVGNTT